MEELIFHYKAFISHTEKDHAWAKRMHTKLNHYSIPSKLRKEHPDLPKNLRPVFWYKRDISELHLKNVIRKELYNSEYLIVICSPDSAQAEWVNEEVRIFKEEFRRGDKIIPFIVDGVANSKNLSDECFPELLRHLPLDEQIRGIDIKGEDGVEGAFINVIATMLKVRYDELYQRYLREKMRKIYGMVAIVAFFLIMAFFICDYFFNTKYEYYLDYADCNGLPVGIVPVDEHQAKNEFRTYRFEYLQNVLRRVVHVDNTGNIQPILQTEYKDRFPIQEMLYENKKLVGIECKSHVGDVICRYNFSKDFNSVNISDEDDNLATSMIRSTSSLTNDQELKARSHFLDNILISPSKIGRYEYDRDSSGYISAIYYCREPYQSNRTTDVNGIAGIKYTRDSLHRVVSLQYVDLHGEPKCDPYGIVNKKYTYDSKGYLNSCEYLNGEGELQCNELGWAKEVTELDTNGYPEKDSYYGKDGDRCTSITGESITRFEWSEASMKMSYFDEEDEPVLITGSASVPGGYHSMLYEFDSNGDIVQMRCYDIDYQLCYNTFHWAINKQVFYKRRPVEQSYWSPEDKPCYNRSYIHCVKAQYENDLIVSESYWGPDEEKMIGPTGFHSVYFEYQNKKVSHVSTYNILGLLSPSLTLINAAQVEIEYKDMFPSAIIFKDAAGNLCADPLRDPNNSLVPYRDWAICRIKNENGLNTEYTYYDTDDKEMLYIDLYFKKVLEFNDEGKEIKTSFYNIENNLTPNEIGICMIETEYDSVNPHLISCITFKNNEGEVCNNNADVARIYKTYYSNGKLKSESYFDEDGCPAYQMGVHLYKHEYDDRNHLIYAMGEGGVPVNNTQQNCHKMEEIFDNYNRISEIKRYDISDSLINRPFPAVTRMSYGNDHQLLKCEYLDKDYNLCNNPEAGNISVRLMKYDDFGRQIYDAFLDENNKLTVNENIGYAECISKYNNSSRIICAKDESGEFVNVQGSCRSIEIYSEKSLPLFGRYDRVNSDNAIEPIQRIVFEYDESGKPTYTYFQDDMGHIYINSLSGSRRVYRYDDEYADIESKIDSIQDSLVIRYFGDVDML